MAQQGNIEQYNSPVDKITPSETGAETLARMGRVEKENYDSAGRAYGQAAKDVGDAVENFQYLQEVSQGAAGLAAMHANLTANWNQAAATTDPNDTSIQKKFMDQADDQLDQWQGGFQTKRGQEWALTQADQTRSHFEVKTSADMGTRAGDAVINNMVTTVNSYKDTAHSDPDSIDYSLNQVDALVAAKKEASAGVLDEKQLGRIDDVTSDMKNEIVKSGIKGLADSKNPQSAIAALNSGHFDDYLTAAEATQLKGYTKVQIHGKQVDAANAQKIQQVQQEQQASSATAKYLDVFTKGGIASATDITANPDLTNQQKSLLVSQNGILSQSPEELHTASLGSNFSQAASAIYSGQPVTTTGLLTAMAQKDISPAGAQQLQKMSTMAKTRDGLAELKAQQSVLNNVQQQFIKAPNDTQGQLAYNNFLNSFYSAWDAGKKNSTISEMSDPNNKSYVGNMAQQFKRSDAQALADITKVQKTQTAAPSPAAVSKQWVFKNGNLVPAGQ